MSSPNWYSPLAFGHRGVGSQAKTGAKPMVWAEGITYHFDAINSSAAGSGLAGSMGTVSRPIRGARGGVSPMLVPKRGAHKRSESTLAWRWKHNGGHISVRRDIWGQDLALENSLSPHSLIHVGRHSLGKEVGSFRLRKGDSRSERHRVFCIPRHDGDRQSVTFDPPDDPTRGRDSPSCRSKFIFTFMFDFISRIHP